MEIMHKGMWTGRRVLYLSVDAIRANPDQPRKYFEPEALRELAESIGRYGILQPLTVRRGEDGYELIAGERRLRGRRSSRVCGRCRALRCGRTRRSRRCSR